MQDRVRQQSLTEYCKLVKIYNANGFAPSWHLLQPGEVFGLLNMTVWAYAIVRPSSHDLQDNSLANNGNHMFHLAAKGHSSETRCRMGCTVTALGSSATACPETEDQLKTLSTQQRVFGWSISKSCCAHVVDPLLSANTVW